MTRALEFQHIADGLLFWEAYEPAVKADLCSCAVRTERGMVVIDPILLAEEAMVKFRGSAQLAAIVVTNENHARAAHAWSDEFRVPVLAHPAAVSALDIQVDGTLEDGALVCGELQVVSLPGAAAGEIALVSPRGSAHVGDALIHLDPYGFSVLPEKYCDDAKSLRDSLRKLFRF